MSTVVFIALTALVVFLTWIIFRLTNPPPAPSREPPPAPLADFPAVITYTVDSDLRQPSHVTPAQLDAFFQGTPMAGLGTAFVAAEVKYGVNAVYLAARAALESDCGRSRLAREKKNLFGRSSADTDRLEHARSFPSFEAGIDHVAGLAARRHLNPRRGTGGDDRDWKAAIAETMNQIARSAEGPPGQAPPGQSRLHRRE